MDPFSPVIRIGAVNPARVAPEEETHAVCSAHLDRKSTRLNSSHGYISYAVFCLKKKKVKVRPGTSSITRGAAMTVAAPTQAIDVGRRLVLDERPEVVLTGDLGIGNTTASASVT